MKKWSALFSIVLLLAISSCSRTSEPVGNNEGTVFAPITGITETETVDETKADKLSAETVDIQILATSDIHGQFYSWNYSTDAENTSGSMLKLASAIREKRNENTLVLEAGDLLQGNDVEQFNSLPLHPVAAAMNYIGYDAWTTGNHEFNFGMNTLKSFIGQVDAQLLLANVLDAEGKPLGQAYAVFEQDGVRIGIIGVVTSNITAWDAFNLKGYTVMDPAEACRKAITELEGNADVLIAIAHMGLENEYDTPNSGAAELAKNCPELDVIVAAHDHNALDEELIGNVLIVKNKDSAQTMAEIHLTVEKSTEGNRLTEKTGEIVTIADYPDDKVLAEELAPFHAVALENSQKVIGVLEGGSLTPKNELPGVPQAQLQDTALMDLINTVMMHYAETDVSTAALTDLSSAMEPGDIRMCDISRLYKFENTLYKLSMTGAQLKKYMEWSARYYRQYEDGDLTVAFDPDIPFFNYDCFSGVNYEINVAKPVGKRIENLTWPDGTPVKDEDVFTIAVNHYRAGSELLKPGIIFEADDLPVILEADIHNSDIGGIREMIIDYIQNVKGGKITPIVDNNWKLTGADWDPDLHRKAVEQVNAGVLSVHTGEGEREINRKVITVSDL